MKHFPHRNLWNGGFSYKITSLPYVQNNPQNKVDEISDSQARNHIELNKEKASLLRLFLFFLNNRHWLKDLN